MSVTSKRWTVLWQADPDLSKSPFEMPKGTYLTTVSDEGLQKLLATLETQRSAVQKTIFHQASQTMSFSDQLTILERAAYLTAWRQRLMAEQRRRVAKGSSLNEGG